MDALEIYRKFLENPALEEYDIRWGYKLLCIVSTDRKIISAARALMRNRLTLLAPDRAISEYGENPGTTRAAGEAC